MTQLAKEFTEMTESLGLDGLADALTQTEPPVSVRINTAKWPEEASGRKVAWCDKGLYLDERPAFTFDPLLHQGAYYVQDASSMIMSHVARKLSERIGRPLAWLDACAAPGGKTTAALSELPKGSVVVANEYVAQRAAVLSENLAKWGYADAVVTVGDTSRFRKITEAFDVIAADVPCSGEGMMRKDAAAVEQWSPSLIRECVARQEEIIDNLVPALKPGGYLVYSTCTFNRQENEEMVDHIVSRYGLEPVDMHPAPEWGVTPGIDTQYPAMRFIPGRTEGEGLFMAVLRKPGDLKPPSEPKKIRKGSGKPDPVMETVRSWLADPDRFEIFVDKTGTVRAMPSSVLLPRKIAAECRPVLTIGVVKGRDVVPSQTLAVSLELCGDRFPQVDVEKPTALIYLRHEAISLPEGVRKGFVLLKYRGLPLGFVKNLGNRANNLYNPSWRILSQLPTELPASPLDL